MDAEVAEQEALNKTWLGAALTVLNVFCGTAYIARVREWSSSGPPGSLLLWCFAVEVQLQVSASS